MDKENVNNPIEHAMKVTGITQEELAKKLNVTRQSINNYKNTPETIPLEKLRQLSRITGMSLDELSGSLEMAEGPILKHVYDKLNSNFEEVLKCVEKEIRSIDKIGIGIENNFFKEIKTEEKNKLEELISIARIQGRKLRMCAFGRPDTGKSTLTNYLLQQEVAPTSYNPETTVITYFMHISEKPSYLSECENTVVFQRRKKNEIDSDLFEHDYFKNKEQAEKYILTTGDYKYIIKECGTRNGRYYKDGKADIAEIMVFLDNDFLKEVTFVDIPGFGSEDKKEDVGLTMDMSKFDVIFFLSLSIGFLNSEEELVTLKQILKSRKNLDYIYILATHANAVGSPKKVEEIMDTACERLVNFMSLGEMKMVNISQSNHRMLRKRFFAFDAYNEFYCEKLNLDLENKLPIIIDKKVKKAMKNFRIACNSYKKEVETQIKKVKTDTKVYNDFFLTDKELNEIISEKIEIIKNKLNESLVDCKKKSLSDFNNAYYKIMNEDFIVEAINNKNIRNKKDDIQAFSSYLSSEINDQLQEKLKEQSEIFVDKLQVNINEYKEMWFNIYDKNKIAVDMNGFDFDRAFAAGLAGLTTYGALAVWATVVAAGSNLGSYILVAKIVSALSAIGISLGGTATVSTVVASLGGPVVLAVTLALMAAISVFGIFSGSWKKRLAKKLIKCYDKENFKGQCDEFIENYWKDTEKALEPCLEKLKSETLKYYKNQMDIIKEEDKVVKNVIISMYNEIVKMYESIEKNK